MWCELYLKDRAAKKARYDDDADDDAEEPEPEKKTKDITNKSSSKAKAEGARVEAQTEHEAVVGELDQLTAANADLHKSCDYTLKNFDLRQSTRDDEIESLKQAIAIFSGASFGAFLQGHE